MNPDRAAAIFRELLQTPEHELEHFSVRNGLAGHPHAGDLSRARELLQAMAVALESGPGPNWARVADAHQAMVAQHGSMNVPAVVAPPQWIRAGNVPAKPNLGDPAPGTHQAAVQQQQRERFVPVAKPQIAPAPAPAPAPTPQPPPQAPPAPPRQPPPPKRRPPQQTAAMPAQAPSGPPPGGAVHESIATYAAFCAACANQPQRVEAIQQEYGIGNAAHRATIDELWQDRFDDDVDLQQQWEKLFAQFRGQLR